MRRAGALARGLSFLFCISSVCGLRRIPGVPRPAPPSSRSDHRLLEAFVEATSPNDHLVTALPGLPPDFGQHWAGLVTVDEEHAGRLFYWLFEPVQATDDAPVVIWLNGGPGCSSMDGLFLENGPLRLKGSSGDLEVNPHAWNQEAYVVFLDQPVGTGLSYISDRAYRGSDEAVNEDLYTFFQGFLQLHSSLQGRDLYFTGESHAGHYIPSFVSYALDRQAAGADDIPLRIQGLAVGNGWTDPYHQYAVTDYAWGRGFVGRQQIPGLAALEARCQESLNKGVYKEQACWDLLDNVKDGSNDGDDSPTVEVYDTRKFSRSGAFPPGKPQVESYLRRSEVLAAIHADSTPQRYKECTDPPYNALMHQDGLGVTEDLAACLRANLRVLYYSGREDLIVNFLGTERSLHHLPWDHADAWRAARRGVWRDSAGGPWGYSKSAANLTFLVVLEAGHMVPMDQPAAALDMLRRFLRGASFADKSQHEFLPTATVGWEASAAGAPQGVRATAMIGEAVVTFEEVGGAEQYEVVSMPDGVRVTTNAAPVRVSGLRDGVPHTFSVRAMELPEPRWSSVSEPVTPGCAYHPPGGGEVVSHCCGNGACGWWESKAACFCAAGYSGQNCELGPGGAATDCVEGQGTRADAGGEEAKVAGRGKSWSVPAYVYVGVTLLAATAFLIHRRQKTHNKARQSPTSAWSGKDAGASYEKVAQEDEEAELKDETSG